MNKATLKANELLTALESLDMGVRLKKTFPFNADTIYNGVSEIQSAFSKTLILAENPCIRIDISNELFEKISFHHLKITGTLDLSKLNLVQISFQNCEIEELKLSNYSSTIIKFEAINNTIIHNAAINNCTINQIAIYDTTIGDWTLQNINVITDLCVASSYIITNLQIKNIDFENNNPLTIDHCSGISDNSSLAISNLSCKKTSVLKLSDIKMLNLFEINSIYCPTHSEINIINSDFKNLKTDCIGLEYFKINECFNFPKSKYGLTANYRTFRSNGFVKDRAWGGKIQQISRIQKELYIELRNKAKEKGNKQLEDDFYFGQMYWSLIEDPNWILSLYNFFFSFGSSWGKPLMWFVLIFGIFYIAYMLTDKLPTTPEELSLLASIPFSATPLKLPFNILLLFFIQKTIQTFFLFEIGSAIRNKVKK